MTSSVPNGLYPIIDVQGFPELSLYRACEQVLAAGVPWLELRDKSLRDKSLGDLSRREASFLREAAQVAYLKVHNRFLLIVNHWVELAAKVGADGVHLTALSMPIPEARKRLGPQALIGYSAHSLEEALRAEANGADYVSFGAIFPTPHKAEGHPIHGLAGLRQVVDSLRIPVIAVGGIGKAEIPILRDLGSTKPTTDRSLHGFSVIRAILADPAPTRATRELMTLWGTY